MNPNDDERLERIRQEAVENLRTGESWVACAILTSQRDFLLDYIDQLQYEMRIARETRRVDPRTNGD